MEKSKLQFFASCAPGIEPLLVRECEQLPIKEVYSDRGDRAGSSSQEGGGVLLKGSLLDVYRCNLHLRSANRITVRLGTFHATSFQELRKKASQLEWEHFLTPGQAVDLSVTCHKSRLYHSGAVAERVLGAINDSFAKTGGKHPCTAGKVGQLILVRFVNDQCTISIDSSGDLLHKRGYRLETAKAPLRETLAAAMLLASGWDGATPLIDPFCGSGTIPIEAALLASRIPPGINREFAFMQWPGFDNNAWQEVLSNARAEIVNRELNISGYDRDAGAIKISTANAARAGQKNNIHFKQQAISDLSPLHTPGWIITNPPYGLRVSSSRDLRDLYARFGGIMREQFSGWRAGILSNDPRLTGNLGLPAPVSEWRFINGGIPVNFQIHQL